MRTTASAHKHQNTPCSSSTHLPCLLHLKPRGAARLSCTTVQRVHQPGQVDEAVARVSSSARRLHHRRRRVHRQQREGRGCHRSLDSDVSDDGVSLLPKTASMTCWTPPPSGHTTQSPRDYSPSGGASTSLPRSSTHPTHLHLHRSTSRRYLHSSDTHAADSECGTECTYAVFEPPLHRAWLVTSDLGATPSRKWRSSTPTTTCPRHLPKRRCPTLATNCQWQGRPVSLMLAVLVLGVLCAPGRPRLARLHPCVQ